MEEKKKRVVGKPFAVGNTVGGRTVGSMNKVTKFSREVLTMALAGQEENIRNALEKWKLTKQITKKYNERRYIRLCHRVKSRWF